MALTCLYNSRLTFQNIIDFLCSIVCPLFISVISSLTALLQDLVKMNLKNALPYTLSPPAEITSSPSFIYFYISAKDCVGSQQWSSGDHTEVLTDFPGWQLLLLQFVAVCPLHGAARSD